MEINTLYQLVSMQLSDPELLKVADRFLLMPDFFHSLLSGSRVVEFTNATTTQCFHPTKGEWAFELLRRLDLPTGMFPQVVRPGVVGAAAVGLGELLDERQADAEPTFRANGTLVPLPASREPPLRP